MEIRLGFRILKHIIAYFIFSCFICVSVNADILDYFKSNEITVIIGETKSLSVSNPRQVKIGNPALLDVVGAGRKELLLSGLAEGETLLTVVDDLGQHIYTVKIFQEDLEKAKERIDILLEAAGFNQLTTKIGDKERKIFILGEFPVSKKESLESRIDSVKDKIVNLVNYYEDIPSIEIDVEVLDIKKTAVDQLGFDWTQSYPLSNVRLTDFLSPSHALKVLKSPWEQDTWTVTLNFLKTRGLVRVLSRPKLVCLSGKEANLLVGGERPIITGSTSTTTASGSTTDYDIELKEWGISLNIKPVVKENDEIQISLKTEVSEIDETQSLTLSSTTSTPGILTRSAETELTVMSGQTVFLAGLIKSKHDEARDGIAGLSSIPFLGALFRSKNLTKEDTEIVITLTPNIIRNRPLQGVASESAVKVSTTSQRTLESRAIETVKMRQAKEDDPVIKYSNLVQSIINSNIKYPQELRDENVEGAVKLSLHLLSTGKLLGVVIMRSSGSQLLDEAAENTVKGLAPFPSFPSDVKLKELWIDVPIVYKSGSRT